MKKALKVFVIIFGAFLVVFVTTILLYVKSLPSSWQIKQTISPRKAQNPAFVVKHKPPFQDKEKAYEDKVDDSKAISMQVLKDDFMNEKKPLSTVCAYLGNASASHFLRDDGSGSANEFMKNLANENNKDPLAEAAAPLFRVLFRMDSVRDLVETVEKAEADNDEGIFKKAEFYTKLGLAGQDIRSSKGKLDQILMKSYNMFMLSRAVGKHPELARDSATLSYCEQIEKNINLNLDFNVEEQATEMQKFLDYAQVDPKEIGYDPNYRSDLQFSLSKKAFVMNLVWIEKLFARDVAKAKKELKEKNNEGSKAAEHSNPI